MGVLRPCSRVAVLGCKGRGFVVVTVCLFILV